jgi:hypothetical protein
MSTFVSDFKAIITADPSINAMITGGIKLSHLDVDYDISKTWLCWDYKVLTQTDTLSKNNCFTEYSIPMTITAPDSVLMNNICDLVINYLNNKTTTNFPDIHLVSDSKTIVLSRTVKSYQNSLEFNATYVG